MTYKMTEEECEEKTGHCWTTPIIHVCQHCGKVQDGPPMHGIDRPGPGPDPDHRLSNPIQGGCPPPSRPQTVAFFSGPGPDRRLGPERDCLTCGHQWVWAFWHRLTRGHWPVYMKGEA